MECPVLLLAIGTLALRQSFGKDCVKLRIVNSECQQRTTLRRVGNPDAGIREVSNCCGVVYWVTIQSGPRYYICWDLRIIAPNIRVQSRHHLIGYMDWYLRSLFDRGCNSRPRPIYYHSKQRAS